VTIKGVASRVEALEGNDEGQASALLWCQYAVDILGERLLGADKSGEPLKPSGKYTRQKDRQNNDEKFRPASNSGESSSDWRRVKVHVGRHTGIDLGELDRESVEALATKWLPTALEMEKPLKADRELIAALQQAKQALSSEEDEEDNIPF
jgi:hypothetical protein